MTDRQKPEGCGLPASQTQRTATQPRILTIHRAVTCVNGGVVLAVGRGVRVSSDASCCAGEAAEPVVFPRRESRGSADVAKSDVAPETPFKTRRGPRAAAEPAFERLSEADLQESAILLATFAYHAAMRDEKIPRGPSE